MNFMEVDILTIQIPSQSIFPLSILVHIGDTPFHELKGTQFIDANMRHLTSIRQHIEA